ncbi:hypothetical protein M2138_000931 [Dysgonomonadaceae bacterium PH5-43]|nr:hypothetical protein [Dysgonomonadaceae bacterium PH5-43]
MRIKLWNLNTEEVSKCFEEIASFNKTLKEQLLCIAESENQTPQNIEQLLKIHYHSWKKQGADELIRLLLEKRKYLLDKTFEYTPENIKNLLRVNRILSEGSEKVQLQARKLFKEIISRNDGFTQDFEIDGTVRVSYNGVHSLFYPTLEEEEEEEKATYPNILEIIDSAMFRKFPKDLYACCYNDGYTPEKEDELELSNMYVDDDGWRYALGTNRPEFQGVRCSWAFKTLTKDSLYALQDIVRLNDFWNEVTAIYQNWGQSNSYY